MSEQSLVVPFEISLGTNKLPPQQIPEGQQDERCRYAYDSLASSEWSDGLHWLEEVQQWSLQYEKANMKPAKSNSMLSNALIHSFYPECPSFLLPYIQQVVAYILGEQTRQAMKLPAPSSALSSTLDSVISLRKVIIRYFSLPRPRFLRQRWINDTPDAKTGNFHALRYLLDPWYVRPSLYQRWGLRAWWTRPLGGQLPGDNGGQFHPEGYRVSTLGPQTQVGKGASYMEETRDRMDEIGFGGCPFHIS